MAVALDSPGIGEDSDISAQEAEVVPVEYEPPDGFEVIFFDVGQGDAILLRFPQGATMLVDGGDNSAGYSVVLPAFKKLNLTDLDYLVVTHADADHCGGLDDVVFAVDVGEVWENGSTKDTWAWWDFSDAVDEKGIPRKVVHRGEVRDIDGCTVTVLNADQGWGDPNWDSIVLAVACEGTKVLLTADAPAGPQADLIKEYGADLKADVVKIPHHGSADRDSMFPSSILPGVAVCSVGAGNPFGHPDPDVVAEWEAVGADFYRTDLSGTITVRGKDGEVKVETDG
jgi:beta-lactamase superfamily II metal-dependent hydrolase